MDNIIFLGKSNNVSAERYGLKVARLHELAQAGFSVMKGFALAKEEHLDHLNRNGLDSTSSSDSVRHSRIDEVLRQELMASAASMGSRFAIRSSAQSEDRTSATRAGQYRTVLDVAIEDIGEAVLEVWASAHPDGTGVAHVFSPMAVLIQPMLDGSAFGVASSIDPFTGQNVALIEIGVSPTSVTSGQDPAGKYEVNPDMMIRPASYPSTLISESEIRTAASLAWAIHEWQHQPIEIEIGWTSNDVIILQSRPLTILPQEPASTGTYPPGNWVLDPVHYPRPLTPLFESIFSPLVRKASSKVFTEYGVLAKFIDLRTIDGWPYVQAVPLSSARIPALPGSVLGLAARIVPSMRRRLLASARALSSNLSAAHVKNWQQAVAPDALAFIADTADINLQTAEMGKLRILLETALTNLQLVIVSNFQTDFAYLIPLAQFTDFMRRLHGWTDSQTLLLVQSSPQANPAYPKALGNLATHLRSNSGAVERLRSGADRPLTWIAGDDHDLRTELEHHRRRWELTLLGYDLDDVTLREAPELERRALLTVLEGNHTRHHPELKKSSELGPTEKDLLARAQRWYHLREEGESVKAALLGIIRLVALETGRRLALTGVIPRSDLALCFTINELSSACAEQIDVNTVTVLNRASARRVAMSHVPEPELGKRPVRDPDLRWLPLPSRTVHGAVTLIAQNEILASVSTDGDTYQGRGASPGVHTGRVRIVSRPGQLREVQAGEVLVASSANSAWSAAFWTAGALVTESGGLLSHSAIVAREMGLPAVLGLPGATTRFTNGDVLTVDGGTGTVIRRDSMRF